MCRPCRHPAQEDPHIAAPLSLSALSIDLVVALAQRPSGAAASELARIVDGAPTSVHNGLRLLAAHGLVERGASRFRLVTDHPAAPELVALGLRLPSPEAATRLVLRASDSVELAYVDPGGFVAGMRRDPSPASLAALDASLATIRRDRLDPPTVLRFEIDELTRIMQSALGLRMRVLSAEILKGHVRAVGRSPVDGYPQRPGSSDQIR